MKRLLTWITALGLGAASAGAAAEPVARASGMLTGPRLGFEDGPLMQLLQRAMIEATGAEAAICSPLPPEARIAAGPITADALRALAPADLRLTTLSMSGEQIKKLLERSAGGFAAYTFEEGRPLRAPWAVDSLFDSFEGLSYELDLTRPQGERVVHLAHRGVALGPGQRLVVAVDQRRLARGDLDAVPDEPEAAWLHEALIAHARRRGVLDDRWERDWSILPDYAVAPERPLIDRLLRHGGAPSDEAMQLYPEGMAQRGAMAYWLARAFGWSERRPSGAFVDVPESLEPWIDGLLRRDVLGAIASAESFQPFAPLTVGMALDWCERAARAAKYTLDPGRVAGFRRGLLAGVGLDSTGVAAGTDTLTRSQALGLIANLRFPRLRVLQGDGLPGVPGSAVPDWIERLLAEDPEGTLWIGSRDTVMVRHGLRLAFHGRPAANGRVEIAVQIGASRTPLRSPSPGDSGIQVSDLVVDPMLRRVIEVIEGSELLHAPRLESGLESQAPRTP